MPAPVQHPPTFIGKKLKLHSEQLIVTMRAKPHATVVPSHANLYITAIPVLQLRPVSKSPLSWHPWAINWDHDDKTSRHTESRREREKACPLVYAPYCRLSEGHGKRSGCPEDCP
jgi:hypothetical protein